MNTIGLIIDIAIIIALVVFGIIGLKKGFLKSVISIFSWVVCLVIAVLLAKYVAGWLNGIYNFSNFIGEKISGGLASTNEFFTQAINTYSSSDALIKAIPSDVNGLLAQLVKVVFSNTNVDMTSTQTIANVTGSSIGHICMVIISGILVFIVLKIAVALLSKLFDKIAKTKILGSLNKILGLVFGALKAALIVVVLNCILVGLSLIPAVNKTITPIIQDNTHVERFIYNKTDEIVGKYVIEGNLIQTWVNDLWSNR